MEFHLRVYRRHGPAHHLLRFFSGPEGHGAKLGELTCTPAESEYIVQMLINGANITHQPITVVESGTLEVRDEMAPFLYPGGEIQ